MKPKPTPKPTKERYYAVRIGEPFRHIPYFKVNGHGLPLLFKSRAEAECSLSDKTCQKVVKVDLIEQ